MKNNDFISGIILWWILWCVLLLLFLLWVGLARSSEELHTCKPAPLRLEMPQHIQDYLCTLAKTKRLSVTVVRQEKRFAPGKGSIVLGYVHWYLRTGPKMQQTVATSVHEVIQPHGQLGKLFRFEGGGILWQSQSFKPAVEI